MLLSSQAKRDFCGLPLDIHNANTSMTDFFLSKRILEAAKVWLTAVCRSLVPIHHHG